MKKGEAKKGSGETKGDSQKQTKMPFLGEKQGFSIKNKGKEENRTKIRILIIIKRVKGQVRWPEKTKENKKHKKKN